MTHLYTRLVAIFHILMGRKFYFAAITSPRITGFDISTCRDLPESKQQRDAFLVGNAIRIDAVLASTANTADADIERMLHDMEGV